MKKRTSKRRIPAALTADLLKPIRKAREETTPPRTPKDLRRRNNSNIINHRRDCRTKRAIEVIVISTEKANSENRITSFQIGPDEEKDSVGTETLLMKLALAESAINEMAHYIDAIEANDGIRPDDKEAPNYWALVGLHQNLMEVSHALKCGCWGYKTAFMC